MLVVPRLLTTLAVLAAGAALIVALAWLFQRKLIYIPITHHLPPARAVLPGSEEVSFETEDGLRLNGWFLPAPGEEGRAAVLVFNGNAGNRSFRTPLAEALADHGFSVLLFDYRGYGDNPGSPTESGLAADARAARGYLASRDDVDPQRIVYFGESLGAAVAIALSEESPPAALVLRSPFTSLVDVGRLHYPFLPVGSLLSDRYPSVERIRKVGAPVLVVAGERDRIIPVSQSRTLYDRAAEPKELVVVPGVGHNDLEMLAGATLVQETVSFARRWTTVGGR